jgi:hypothetical protein
MQVKEGYSIELVIKDIKLTDYLKSLRIISSINTAYQIFTISAQYNTNKIILDDILGKYPLKLTLNLVSNQSGQPSFEKIDMELQYVDSDLSIAEGKPQQSDQDYIPDLTLVNITAIARKSFKTMSQIVNDVFIGKTPKQIIQELASKTQAEVEYDSDNENTDVIDQVVIPPSTFYNSIRYLDDNYGLFKGVSNLGFCQYDNKLYIQNLTARMNKNQTFTIDKLASDDSENPKIISENTTEKRFFTIGTLTPSYSGSAQFTAAGKTIKHIVHPDNKLYDTIEQDMNKVCADYGAIAKNSEITLDPNINDREVYMINHSGNNDSDIYANVQIGRKIIGMSELKCGIKNCMYLLNLFKVGEPVKLKCYTKEEINLGGKYILKSSDINFKKEQSTWESACFITLMRTNKYV